jgi:Raf kinase inhibitor-like YbhB/YbcL family protein
VFQKRLKALLSYFRNFLVYIYMPKSGILISFIIIVCIGLFFLLHMSTTHPDTEIPKENTTTEILAPMKLQSVMFADGGLLPRDYTCDGSGKYPPLSISGVPADTKSLALTVTDSDAPKGDYVHWVLWNIDPTTVEIPEGTRTPTSVKSGLNSGGTIGWVPPCPPQGMHHYEFHLYALDTELTFTGNPTKADLLSKMHDHILEEAVVTGLYARS